MCLVVFMALAATAYLAVFFNRRAKADLEAALAPLAAESEGTIQLDEAEVSGKYRGDVIYARMANATEGPGRVFQVDVVDSVGGTSWQYTSNPVSKSSGQRTVDYSGPEAFRAELEKLVDAGARVFLDPESERFRVEYLLDKGIVRLVRSMQTRRDIPDAASFRKQLALLTDVAAANRVFIESQPESSRTSRKVEG